MSRRHRQWSRWGGADRYLYTWTLRTLRTNLRPRRRGKHMWRLSEVSQLVAAICAHCSPSNFRLQLPCVSSHDADRLCSLGHSGVHTFYMRSPSSERIMFIWPIVVQGRSQWPRGLRHELSSLVRKLGSWVRIPLKTLRHADPPSKEPYRLCVGLRN
jgi:hypothetical protein